MRVSVLGQASVHARFFRVYGILFWGSWGRFCGWKRAAKAPGCSPRPAAHFPSLPRAIGPLFVQLATTLDKNSYPLLAQPLADKANPKAKMQSKIHDPVVSGQSTKNKRERQSEKMMTTAVEHGRSYTVGEYPLRDYLLGDLFCVSSTVRAGHRASCLQESKGWGGDEIRAEIGVDLSVERVWLSPCSAISNWCCVSWLLIATYCLVHLAALSERVKLPAVDILPALSIEFNCGLACTESDKPLPPGVS